ncbi:hypothetical protein TTHERM_00633580 (macronuclear) [Tetrahymena thermophila SB210]|uniref:Uncharacterized protein n=1 Tax=Tetrahymena thermophila (strain SB210) TaxID=312017 RepID=Q22WZ5_TETTS|nr:hypothetical protein TTHERM_00633580 [Tetrahymena thermophila SB210]EAR89851.2 hypothetical protein TTHERM_00633580 [Tetrahymena thermophila SB210]|eukprot:XP_001010096.2 hypothetical protein TTHERM_00633580 [Tetrahymena thermophila SB210]
MLKQGSIKGSQVSQTRPQTSKPFTKVGQEQSVNPSPRKDDLRDSNLRKSKEDFPLRDSNQYQDQQPRKQSPPLFKYKAKFVAKKFNPFEQLEQEKKAENQQLEEQTEEQKNLEKNSTHTVNSLNSSHKFKKLSNQELNLISPIAPSLGSDKNVFFQEKQITQLIQVDENNIVINENQSKQETEEINDDNQDKLNEVQKVQQEFKKVRPHTAAIMKAQPIKNIFDAAKVYERYLKNEIGPQTDEQGQIKQYTILGKPEWFIKQQKEFNKKIKAPTITIMDNSLNGQVDNKLIDTKSMCSNDKLDKNDTSVFQSRQISQANLGVGGSNVPKVISMNNLTQTQFTKASKRANKEEDVQVQELDEEELQICIDKVIQRVQSNKEFAKRENEKQISKFKKGDQLYLTKEARILQQFEDVQKQQQKIIELRCKQVGKKFEDSLWLKDGEVRSKNEIKQVLEMVKTDLEKFGGQNYWQKRLRKDKEDRVIAVEAIQKLVKEDNPLNFKPKNQFDQEMKVQIVEQVRKPFSSKLRTEKQNELPFHSFKSHDYLQSKIQDRKYFINEIARIDNKDIENIEIVGKNVLRQEIQTLKNNASEKNFIMKVKTQKKEQTQIQTPVEEVQAKQADKKHLSPRNRAIFDKKIPHTSNGTRLQSPKQPTSVNLRSVVKILTLPEKPALVLFLEQQQNLQNQEEEIIEEKYIPYEMRRGGYVQQQIKLHY